MSFMGFLTVSDVPKITFFIGRKDFYLIHREPEPFATDARPIWRDLNDNLALRTSQSTTRLCRFPSARGLCAGYPLLSSLYTWCSYARQQRSRPHMPVISLGAMEMAGLWPYVETT
jgi:hypothetical protein